jgi:large subunit ribosomal protein L5
MYTPRLKDTYRNDILPALKEKYSYKSIMQVPKIEKIILSQGVGKAVADKKLIENSVEELSLIAGQKALVTHSKKDISNFKVRKGMPIGTKVTLRGDKMYEFLDRLVAVALPRTRGNYNMGIKEQIIFPEIDIDKVANITGMDITIVTSASTDDEAYDLLKAFGLPFKDR